MGAADNFRRLIGSIYSVAAERVYEPIVVRGTFRLLGGSLNEAVADQGRGAVAAAAGGPVLDMPVGTGYFTLEVARRHEGLVVGVDLAEGMVRRARRVARQHNLHNLAIVRADAHRLPFRTGAFGSVLCSNGLQVIPGLEQTLAELARVLAPDGKLFASVVGIPVSGALPPSFGERLPAILRSERDLLRAMARAGLDRGSTHRTRLAILVEASRAAP
ncbi:MAG: class I SAM-dependent methyltransferase [Actinomycetota bacterium]